MKKLELVFIPTPVIGHLTAAVHLANLLTTRHLPLSITILIIKLPFPTKSAPLIQSLCSSSASDRIRFITLPEQPIPNGTKRTLLLDPLVQSQKQNVATAVANLTSAPDGGPDSPTLAGFVVDMFCIPMVDVANQFGVPTFVFYTSSASFLALLFHLQELYDNEFNHDMDRLLNSATEFAVPCFRNPIPRKVISTMFIDREATEWTHALTRRYREANGFLINTFFELEPDAIHWFAEQRLPPVYAVGPILNQKKNPQIGESGEEIMKWLDEQPPSSVVFLCFGTMGSFNESQTKEIAEALERTGVRFIWAIRQTPPESVLPEGFVDRTGGIGKVIGWAPQVEILKHPATGGFVSHCGWNSVLESLWNAVAVATWPMYAEQQVNAFEMGVELGVAVEVSLDYSMMVAEEEEAVLTAEKIEGAIRRLMERSDELKRALMVKGEESKKAMMESGSSFNALNRFIDAIMPNRFDSNQIIEVALNRLDHCVSVSTHDVSHLLSR
ncbi:anthocyanidin 3-O-glucosyltransferase 2-like [Cucurbita moschata]|uniref:Anthocyanidin 3-O-glucosyltransferase 2-like n=1 Tax=Cucurbita moschata TaxID=3662 RepID=A0A6J1FLG4_CUCMO|nr:anthocyanidin 3-O-glucosyltransferase 2-like [Cucurbita moschata]